MAGFRDVGAFGGEGDDVVRGAWEMGSGGAGDWASAFEFHGGEVEGVL